MGKQFNKLLGVLVRAIKERELPLVEEVLEAGGFSISDYLRVTDMSDGGMGSLMFQPGSSITQFGVVKRFFRDQDGTLVSVELNLTAEGKPAELDIWKVDFSPLLKWPTRSDIYEKPPNK